MSASAPAVTRAATSGWTTATPRSTATTAFLPRSSWRWLPRPASHPSTRGRLWVSCGSYPLQTSYHRAVSRTDLLMQPIVTVCGVWCTNGPRGIRPKFDFRPNMPVKPAGIRIDPPPSPPEAIGTRPPATAAAVPPDDPPGVRSGFQGLRVAPCNRVLVTLIPPNSLAVV